MDITYQYKQLSTALEQLREIEDAYDFSADYLNDVQDKLTTAIKRVSEECEKLEEDVHHLGNICVSIIDRLKNIDIDVWEVEDLIATAETIQHDLLEV